MTQLQIHTRGPNRLSINADALSRLSSIDGKQTVYWHPVISGLGLHISGKSEKRHWIVQTRVNGRVKRLRLLDYGADVGEVERKGSEWLAAMRAGRNPLETEQAEALNSVPIFGDAVENMLEVRKESLRPATVRTYRAMFKYCEDWNTLRVDTINPSMVIARYQHLTGKKSVATANLWLATVTTVFSYLVDVGTIDKNPTRAVKSQRLVRSSSPRQVVLKPEDYATFFDWIDVRRRYGEFGFIDALEFILITGARRSEVSGLTWDEIDLDAQIWHLPEARSKSKKGRSIPLGRRAVEILRHAQEVAERVHKRAPRQRNNPLVFYAGADVLRPKKTPLSGWGSAVDALQRKLGYRVNPHDLRRTYATEAGLTPTVPETARKMILGHALNLTEEVYTVFPDEVLVEFGQAVEDRILTNIG